MPIRVPSPLPGRPVVPPPTPVPSTPAQLKAAEKMLTRAGFSPGAIDGKVTPAFTKALKEFQASLGLAATGTLDARTTEKLGSVDKRIRTQKDDLFVSVGQKSNSIKVLEQRLGKLGYTTGKADGIFSRETGAAVKAFRKDQKELSDGAQWLGKKARQVLKSEASKLAHAPERRRIAPTKAQARLDRLTQLACGRLQEGSKGAAVKNVQAHLKAAGFDPKHTNGTFDERTGAAVKAFQAKSKLPVTGAVDQRTWTALKKSYILSKKPADPAQKLGERSGAVKASEKLLKKLGFNPGRIDGLFDARTARAVKAYEKKARLKQDGAIGTNQLAKMKKDAKGDYRDKVLDTARRFLGFHEKGTNGNPFSKFFGRPPEAWCADFVSYCYTKAGKKLNECNTPNLLAKLHANGTYTRNDPKPGDIIMFDWHPGTGPTAEHTGLVEKVFRKNGRLFVQTIEGNSGDAVRRLTYAVGDARIAGFGTMR
jgi:peptidoglycan hydrolase-like protein with peptidoglycan-binding domain